MVWEVAGYEALGPLGEGRTGSVVKCRDRRTGLLVAVKYLSAGVCGLPGLAERLRTEVPLLAAAAHTHLNTVYELVEGPSTAAIVTEMVDGLSLRQVLDEGTLDPETALYVLRGVFAGLGELHRRGIVHRDIRPENILIDTRGTVKVTDAGVPAPDDPAVPGDARYRAPELWARHPAGGPSDVYAATAVLVECLTGTIPSAPPGAHATPPQSGEHAAPPPPGAHPDLPPGVPDRIHALIARNLDPDPARRMPQANAVLDDLELVMLRASGHDWLTRAAGRLDRRTAPILRTRRLLGEASRRAAAPAPAAPAPAAPAADTAGSDEITVAFRTVAAASASASPWPGGPPGAVDPYTDTTSAISWHSVIEPTDLLQSVGTEDTSVAGRGWSIRTAVLVASALVVLLLLGGVAIATSAFVDHPAAGSATAPTYTHTPVLSPGPSVPPPAKSGHGTDRATPTIPLDLRVISAALTVITLQWAPSTDNIGVAGYLIVRDGQRVGTTGTSSFTATGLTADQEYRFSVIAFDAAGNLSEASAAVLAHTLAASDHRAPSVPTGLRTTGSDTTLIVLAWDPSHDNKGVAGYDVFRDGTLTATVTLPFYTDTHLTPDTAYRYSVRAFDASNNASAPGPAQTFRTTAVPDTTPPSTPAGLTATAASATSAVLSWSASADNVGVVGYVVSRNGKQLLTVTATSYADSSLAAATTYTYSVAAIDASGNTSKPATVQVTTPALPALAPSPTTSASAAAATLTTLTVTASPVSGTACLTTLTADLTTGGGSLAVELTYSIDGTVSVRDVTVNGTLEVPLGDVTVTADGSVTVSAAPSGGLPDAHASWTAPQSCRPGQATAPPATPVSG